MIRLKQLVAAVVLMPGLGIAHAQVDWDSVFEGGAVQEERVPPPPAEVPPQPVAAPPPQRQLAVPPPAQVVPASGWVAASDRVETHVNVRDLPSLQSNIVGLLRPGVVAALLGVQEGWSKVRLSNGIEGFVSQEWTVRVATPQVARPSQAAPPPITYVEPRRSLAAPQPARPAVPAPAPQTLTRPIAPAPARDELLPVEPRAVPPVPEQPQAETAQAPAAIERPVSAPASRAESGMSLANLGLREGDAITPENYERYREVLTPGVQWAIGYGWRLPVVEPKPIVMPAPYREATEKYSGQVRISLDGLRLENYVAGLPFPHVDPNEPKAVLKMMWNFYYNFTITDDITWRYFDPRTGSVERNQPLDVERAFIVEHYRKLNYNGRLFVDPKPELPNPEEVRFKESVHPIIEPFDIKGTGATFWRYLDPAKQDDSWVYIPSLRRVRRLSTAQRSDALFGQDVDADSFAGYNGHIAWMGYRLLGERTVLATMHARNVPIKWQQPNDWLYDDVWEPRRVWVIEAVSKFPQYAYGKRILFMDKEGWLIPLTDSYDRAGQLWKSQAIAWSFRKESIPGAKLGRYEHEWPHQTANVVFDVQLRHATSNAAPSPNAPGEEGMLLNMGPKVGTTEDFFTVAHLIAFGR